LFYRVCFMRGCSRGFVHVRKLWANKILCNFFSFNISNRT
jgi:hypothetical protein